MLIESPNLKQMQVVDSLHNVGVKSFSRIIMNAKILHKFKSSQANIWKQNQLKAESPPKGTFTSLWDLWDLWTESCWSLDLFCKSQHCVSAVALHAFLGTAGHRTLDSLDFHLKLMQLLFSGLAD